MKQLIVVNGTMGAGKSTVCEELLRLLTPAAMLDGDWCWKMNPFVVSRENQEMVLDNISYLLRSYLCNSGFEYVIFCWVLHQEGIWQELAARLEGIPYRLHRFTLMLERETLVKRLTLDVQRGLRTADVIQRSVERLPLYDRMPTHPIRVDRISAAHAARMIAGMVRPEEAPH